MNLPPMGGPLRLIASVDDSRAIREVLQALALSPETVDRAPSPSASIDVGPTTDASA